MSPVSPQYRIANIRDAGEEDDEYPGTFQDASILANARTLRATVRRGRPHPVSWVSFDASRDEALVRCGEAAGASAERPRCDDAGSYARRIVKGFHRFVGPAESYATTRHLTSPRRGSVSSPFLAGSIVSERRARCQRAGDTHARTHARNCTHTRTHIHTQAHTDTHGAHIALPRANGAREPRLSQSRKRSRGRSYLYRGCDISPGGPVRRKRERERQRDRERGGMANLDQTAWIGLLGCRSRRWLRHRANSIALLDIDGYGGGGGGGDDGGDAAATTAVAAAGKRRLSIFPRSLRDWNTPVRVSPAGAPASPVGGLLGPARSLGPRFSSSSFSLSFSLSPSFSPRSFEPIFSQYPWLERLRVSDWRRDG